MAFESDTIARTIFAGKTVPANAIGIISGREEFSFSGCADSDVFADAVAGFSRLDRLEILRNNAAGDCGTGAVRCCGGSSRFVFIRCAYLEPSAFAIGGLSRSD